MMTPAGKIFKARADIAHSDLPDGMALLDMQAGKYYSLDQVGACIWNYIKSPADLGAIVNVVTENFEVAADACRADICLLLESLSATGLLEVSVAEGAL